MRWELGQDVTVQRLLWVMEYVTRIADTALHELGFYYLVDLPEHSPFLDMSCDHAGVERGHELLLRWFPVGTLPGVELVPEFLRTALRRVPDSPQHIVRADDTD